MLQEMYKTRAHVIPQAGDGRHKERTYRQQVIRKVTYFASEVSSRQGGDHILSDRVPYRIICLSLHLSEIDYTVEAHTKIWSVGVSFQGVPN